MQDFCRGWESRQLDPYRRPLAFSKRGLTAKFMLLKQKNYLRGLRSRPSGWVTLHLSDIYQCDHRLCVNVVDTFGRLQPGAILLRCLWRKPVLELLLYGGSGWTRPVACAPPHCWPVSPKDVTLHWLVSPPTRISHHWLVTFTPYARRRWQWSTCPLWPNIHSSPFNTCTKPKSKGCQNSNVCCAWNISHARTVYMAWQWCVV